MPRKYTSSQLFQAITQLQGAVEHGFINVDKRLDHIETRLTSVEGEVRGLKAQVGDLTVRVDKLTVRVDDLTVRVEGIHHWMKHSDKRFEALEYRSS